MPELSARSVWEGQDLPLALGDVEVTALPELARLSIAPYLDRLDAVSASFADRVGAALPDPGSWVALDGGRLIWAGYEQWFLEGPSVDGLSDLAALTDQSDAWAGLRLTGDAAAEVLARLVPIDLDPTAFPEGSAARTLLGHMACLLIATGDGFDILVMRSFARTALHDIATAMRMLAGRAALDDG